MKVRGLQELRQNFGKHRGSFTVRHCLFQSLDDLNKNLVLVVDDEDDDGRRGFAVFHDAAVIGRRTQGFSREFSFGIAALWASTEEDIARSYALADANIRVGVGLPDRRVDLVGAVVLAPNPFATVFLMHTRSVRSFPGGVV